MLRVYHRSTLLDTALASRKRRLVARKQTKTKEFREVVKQMRKLPTTMVNDPEFIRVKYLRYADGWIVGICGPKSLAEDITREIGEFLLDTLKLSLSKEKTHITNVRTEDAHFLGTTLAIGNAGLSKIVLTTNRWGRPFKRRSTGWETVIKAPLDTLIKKLKDKGFCTHEGKPLAKRAWARLDEDQIVALYSGVNRGIQNYYRFVDNWRSLTRIQHILHYSLVKILAFKLNISIRKVFRRFGKDPCITVAGKDGKRDREVRFYLNQDWSKNREAFQQGNHADMDQLSLSARLGTRSKLGKPCCICGKTAQETQIVIHHVRHIRKLSNKREAVGFNHILRMLNRKQIPVCENCHRKIHQGTYDGLRLSHLAYHPT